MLKQDVPWIVDNLDVEGMIKNGYGIGREKGTERFEPVMVNEYYPRYITENLKKFKNSIVENAVKNIYDIYP